MDHRSLLERIMHAVDRVAYLTPSHHVDPRQRDAMAEIGRAIQSPDFDPESVRRMARDYHEKGRIDQVMMLSALHVVAAHPRVQDWVEAARLVGEQEFAALEIGGPNLDANLASVERHRGVLAFLRGHHEMALDCFTRALERQRTPENLGNVLCALVRLGEVDDALALYAQMRRSLPASLVQELAGIVDRDPDLALLRTEDS
jgi:pentatricopeptide repeat protein